MEIKVVNPQNQEVVTVEIKEEIAKAPIKQHAVWETVKWQLAKRRRGTHSTKTRGEVRGGGRKPGPRSTQVEPVRVLSELPSGLAVA